MGWARAPHEREGAGGKETEWMRLVIDLIIPASVLSLEDGGRCGLGGV